MQITKVIIEQIALLDNWFKKNENYGYDLYDLYDNKIFNWLILDKPLFIRKGFRKLISWWIKLFPKSIIILFRKKKNINPKAMGLLLKGYCNLFETTNEIVYLEKAKQIGRWLCENRSNGIKGYGWGYPFDWVSQNKMITKFTASVVVTTIVGDGFFKLFELTSDESYLIVCDNICHFIINDLNIDHIDEKRICFSYTPIDNHHVNNANLFASEFLVRVGKVLSNKNYIQEGVKALNYTLSQQTKDGSIYYWGEQDTSKMRFTNSGIDHYHSGFELRMLWALWKHLADEKIKTAFERYYEFYFSSFIFQSKPLIRPHNLYPINIHVCAEAIICNCTVNNGTAVKEEWFIKYDRMD